MPQARDEAGNIWEVDAQGNAVALVQAAAPSAPSPMTFGTPDPSIEEDRRRKAEADARARRDQELQEAEATRNAAEWAATHNPDGSKKTTAAGFKPLPDGAAKRYEDAINAFAAYDRAIGGFTDDYAGNAWTGELENKAQNLIGTGTPGQAEWWADFRTTDNMVRNALFGASLTEGEKQAYQQTTINPRMTPDRIQENLARRRELARDVLARRTNFLKTNGYNPEAIDALAGEYVGQFTPPSSPEETGGRDDNEVAAAMAAPDPSPPDLPPANEGGLDPGMAPASGATRRVRDDRLAGQIDAMINAGADEATINAVLSQQGYQALPLGSLAAARSWMKANPGQRYYGANPGKEVPLSLPQRIAGSPFGAGLAHYTNAATAGTVGAMAGDQGKGALDAMAAMNPNAAMLGQITGSITGVGAAELGLGARLAGTGLARLAPRAADALHGGLYGFNEAEEGEGAMGALAGATVGAVSGAVGERAMRGAGAVARGVADPMVQRLRDAGVPLTVGQAVGNSGALGAGVKKVEDALTSVPFVGNMVEARRMEGLQGFNQAAFERAAAPGTPITSTGAPGMAQVRQGVQDAYGRALDPVDLDIAGDPQALADIANAQLLNANLPQGVGERAADAIDYRIGGSVDQQGRMTGRDFQEAYRGLGRDRRTAPDPYASEFGQSMRAGQDALGDALERQHPGAFGDFVEANASNRRAEVLAAALRNASNQTDELITPAQLNRADVQSTSRLEGAIQSASGNRPFYDLASAGQSVLPSRLPDSGTSTRAMVGFGLANAGLVGGGAALGGTEGAGVGTGLGLGATIALALGGSKPAQQMLTGAVLNRPAIARAVGEAITRNSQIGGWTGAGVLTPLLVGPQ